MTRNRPRSPVETLPVLGLAFFVLSPLGCVGEVITAGSEVALVQMRADKLGALLSQECVATYGESGCSRYPNPLACDALAISVRGDGQTCGACTQGGREREVCGGVSDGIPIICKAATDLQCHVCTDIYGNTIVNTCTDGAEPYRSNGAEGGGFAMVPEPDSAPPASGPGPGSNDAPGGGECDGTQARILFAKQLNAILVKEGIGLTYTPNLSVKINPNAGFWGAAGMFGKVDLCKQYALLGSFMTQCDSNQSGKCHCSCAPDGKQTCRCARMTTVALRAVCEAFPPGCDYKTWVANAVVEFGAATQWLFAASYANAGYYGGLPSVPPSGDAPPNTGAPPGDTPPGTNIPPTCVGSPLVLDLADDGVRPTSVAGGVTFDLLGHGPMRTAWVTGDDALLVLDRNGNGRVDDGGELFGPGTPLAGSPAEDGFAALARLDHPAEGGNDDGRLDASDLMFGELQLWNDSDRDGVSGPGELQPLSTAGVRSVEILGARSCGLVTDAHGNDLSLRGGFTREDGSRGLLVDVFFVVTAGFAGP